ncbi:SH2 domain-containing protein 2A [Equus quagga]|uniref:SH2 domain containing 2A n=2 Tax=Equus TaxID=9789 RepID=F6WFW7_HORSE|nr:SH2 domain-containing protein 2A [Equus caballus]XP_023496747.1 SH2 domain-containing protein 2A [Equus caballus]XP_023496748.1 SH2 domain-containing protein 2A [Equus caballus]XP_046538341.1 SH2 domain-containing protein 2A [Equus quagga]XP_046538342.1 SH2 domain-containing protein 2A [Equus quagga]XP_046538343.1 SH2 domain-containing protein 2A [Equus quagga]
MEFPLTQICPQGSRETPAPTFSTFQPLNLTSRSCQGLGSLPGPRFQAPKAEEAQPSPRAPAVHAVALGAFSNPENAGKAEEVPREGGQSLQAEILAWFQKTQAHWLLQHGAAPAWFHGFITRREAEKLLETKPEGCYLVRFSESAVTFVLTYRSRTCCRHFLLAQLGDGRHVVLGEDSAHARLQDLLWHYMAYPLSPYGETLTEPLARQTPEPAGLSLRTEESDSGNKSQDPHPQYSPILKKEQTAAFTQKDGPGEPNEPFQPPRPKPRVPAKPQLPPEVYTSPAPRPRPAPPPKPSNPIYQEPDEPIAFYAMGRGSPGEAPSNIYAEVDVNVDVEAPAVGEGPPSLLQHLVLRKCRSKPVPGSQNPGGWQLHSENSMAGHSPPAPHQPQPRWGNTLPNNLSRQVLQDRGQTWLPLGPPQ